MSLINAGCNLIIFKVPVQSGMWHYYAQKLQSYINNSMLPTFVNCTWAQFITDELQFSRIVEFLQMWMAQGALKGLTRNLILECILLYWHKVIRGRESFLFHYRKKSCYKDCTRGCLESVFSHLSFI